MEKLLVMILGGNHRYPRGRGLQEIPQGKNDRHEEAGYIRGRMELGPEAHRKRMRKANQYGQAALADPAVRAHYEKRAARVHGVPYRLALSDYFKGKNLFSQPPTLPPQ